MRITAMLCILGGALALTHASALRADEWNKLTKITFSGPVEVPGKVLPAGTYIFKLLDSPSNRNVVEIYNADQTHLEDLVLAVADQRLRPTTHKNVIQFSERPAGSPVALKAWFYPGSTQGEEFVYPHDRAVELAKENHETVYSTKSDLTPYMSKHMKSEHDPDAAKMKQSQVQEVQPNGSENDVQ